MIFVENEVDPIGALSPDELALPVLKGFRR